jgi:hypothetical protein
MDGKSTVCLSFGRKPAGRDTQPLGSNLVVQCTNTKKGMELVPGPGIGHPAGFGAPHNSGGNGCRRLSRSAEILSINLLAGRHESCLERVFTYESGCFLGALLFRSCDRWVFKSESDVLWKKNQSSGSSQ